MARPKKQKAEKVEVVEKGKELFDFLNMIYQDQRTSSFDDMTEVDKKKYKYSRYMMHRFLSMNPGYSPLVNELQKYSSIPDRAHYQFLTNVIPRGRQFNKYIKGDKDEKYEKWLVELVANHFHVSKIEAIGYIELYYRDDKDALRTLCEMYGIDKKELKKVKL
jgi:DNA-directed RNA polymerase subunit K/omega